MIKKKVLSFNEGDISKEDFNNCLTGWEGYAKWANSYGVRVRILEEINHKNNKLLLLSS